MDDFNKQEKKLYKQIMSQDISHEQQILNRVSDGIEAKSPIGKRINRGYEFIEDRDTNNYYANHPNKIDELEEVIEFYNNAPEEFKNIDNGFNRYKNVQKEIEQATKNYNDPLVRINDPKGLETQKDFIAINSLKPNLTEEQQLAKNIKEQLDYLETDRIVSPREGQKIMQEVKTGEGKSVIDRQFKGTQGGSFEDRLNNLSSGNKYNSRKAKQAEQEVAEMISKNKSKLKELGEESGEGLMKGFLKSPTGKLMAGIGVTAFLVSNMNNSKGQQSNAELYGQQSPYQY